ncbi:hypothetical protein ACF0H5_005249 [Mactra antiquata]
MSETVTTPYKASSISSTTQSSDNDSRSGPSWGLIIPIIMIGVFLISVALCLWWHKWRDKRTLHLPRSGHHGSSFHRSYRRSSHSGSYAIRDSNRSTTPLRNSLNEKIATNNNNNVKLNNVNVIPVQPRQPDGKYAFYWDKNHFKACPTTTVMSSSGRLGTKPLSPINEIESPASGQISELSRNYDLAAQAQFSPYHLAWHTQSSGMTSYEHSDPYSRDHRVNRYPPQSRGNNRERSAKSYQNYEQPGSSPFFPNNNTPTTECDTESEASQIAINVNHGYSYHPSSHPTSPNRTPGTNASTNDTNRTSLATSYPESSFQTCSTSRDQSHYHTSVDKSDQTIDHNSNNISSLPSSIAPFSKMNTIITDDNNNSLAEPNAYMTYPMAKVLNYTLASSIASSDTHMSDNTSLLPNIGSTNTSGYPAMSGSRSYPQSVMQSGPTSPEDLSKLVNEMSSIRPVEETSSHRPTTSTDPTSRIISVSGHSTGTDLHRSWSVDHSSLNSTRTGSSKNGSLYWDNYPLHRGGAHSYPDLPIEMHDSFIQQTQRFYQRPVLMETQYWV